MEPNKKEVFASAATEETTPSPAPATPAEEPVSSVPDIETEPPTSAHMNNINNIDPDPQTALENMDPDATPADKAKVFTQPKKSHTKIFIIIAAVLVVFLAAAVAYYFLYMQPKPATSSTTTPSSSETTSTLESDVTSATDTLTQGNSDESAVTNTDDSSYITDTDTSAAGVGDSIDESTF